MYVLDTNSLSYFFKGLGRVGERLLATPPADIAIPAVVLFEIEFGLVRLNCSEKHWKQLRDLISVTTVLPFGPSEARASAQIRYQVERAGTPVGPYDILIAGTALSHGAVLVTHNTRELSRVQGLTLEDWY